VSRCSGSHGTNSAEAPWVTRCRASAIGTKSVIAIDLGQREIARDRGPPRRLPGTGDVARPRPVRFTPHDFDLVAIVCHEHDLLQARDGRVVRQLLAAVITASK
jgi:hypothetical protein